MQLTRKAEYAIRAMVDIATHYDSQPVMSKDIAARQDIPSSFLIQIMPELKSSGLIHTARGNGGGIYLSRKPAEINIRQVVEAIEGPIALNQCLVGDDSCRRKPTCPVHVVWRLAQTEMLSVLESTTLAGLVGLTRSKETAARTLPPDNGSRISNEVEIEV